MVDDESTILRLLERVLSYEGYEVESVDNATDALDTDTRDFLSKPNAHYSTKPFDTTQLTTYIHRILTQGTETRARSGAVGNC